MIEIVQIALASCIAGLLDTVVGFGGGLLLLPILVALLGGSEAVVLTAVIPLGWNLTRLPILRSFIDLRALKLFTLGIVPGAFIGGLFLQSINADHLGLGIGILLVVLGGFHILRLYVELPTPSFPEQWSFPIVGFVAGGLTALLGAGNGPLQSWTMSAAGVVPQSIVAVNGALGVLASVARLLSYGIEGMLRDFPWTIAIVGVISGAIGSYGGIKLSRRAADSTLKLIIGIVIIIAGIRLIV